MDNDNDQIWDADEIQGCLDPVACNFDATATDSNNSCVYAGSGLDCAGNCLFDVDANGTCDELDLAGCMDETACNYNENATQEGDCIQAAAG